MMREPVRQCWSSGQGPFGAVRDKYTEVVPRLDSMLFEEQLGAKQVVLVTELF